MTLVQGTLDVLVLQALAAGVNHGYGVAQWIRRTTDGTLEIEDGALYTSLHRMEKRGLLKASWGTSEKSTRPAFSRIKGPERPGSGIGTRSFAPSPTSRESGFLT